MSFGYSISLQVWHPHADPEILERGLGLVADHKAKAGVQRQTPKGASLPGVYRESYCSFRLASGDDGELADCLDSIVGDLSSSREFIAKTKKSGGRLNFFVSWTCGDRGEVFSVSLLEKITDLGIDLGIQPFHS